MRLNIDGEKLDAIVALVQEYVDASENRITDFMDGGDEGWSEGDDEQQAYLNEASADEIADWVIAGLR